MQQPEKGGARPINSYQKYDEGGGNVNGSIMIDCNDNVIMTLEVFYELVQEVARMAAETAITMLEKE